MTKKEIIDLEKICKCNLSLGGMCFSNCRYRENGMCELSFTNVLRDAIRELKIM